MKSVITTFGMFLLAGAACSGCTWTSDGGITQRRVSSWEGTTASAQGSFDDSPIDIYNTMGEIQVVGVPGKTNITLRARFVAGANSDADAQAAFKDVESQLEVQKQNGVWQVACNQAAERHGSATPSSTGCDLLVVEVPAGSDAKPLSFDINGDMGGAYVTGVSVKKLHVRVPFGIIAQVTPVSDADINLYGEDLISGMCNTVLSVPEDTGFQQAALTVQSPDIRYVGEDPNDPAFENGVSIEGFPDAPSIPPRTGNYTWTRTGQPMTSSVTLRASLGKAILTTAPVPPADDMGSCAKIEVQTP